MPVGSHSDRPWGPVEEQMAEALASDPTDIPGVVTTLLRVQRALDNLPPLYHDNPVADFNADGSVNSTDFFAFLTAFFAGC